MATYIPIDNIPKQYFDDSGDPLVGGELSFFLAGTTTATNAFSDDAGTSIGSTIDLNAYGYPEAGGNTIGLFRDQSKALKIVLKDATAATIWTMDDIPAVASYDAASSTKLDLITVTGEVDLDTMETDIDTSYQIDGTVLLTEGIAMPTTKFITRSIAAGLTAGTTQTQGGGLALLNQVNQIATCANSNDSVTLPEAAAGKPCIVINNGAETLQVFPAVDDSIDDGAADASMTIPAGEAQIFEAIGDVIWKTLFDIAAPALPLTGGTMTGDINMSADIVMGAGQFVLKTVTSGIVADITQTQGQGPLTSAINEVATVTTTNDTVTLPTAVTGTEVKVINNGVNALQVFPASGDDINGNGVDTGVSQAAGDNIIYVAYDATNWGIS